MALAISHGSSIIVPAACLPMSLSFISIFVALPPCLSVWFTDEVQGCQSAPGAMMMELRVLSLLSHSHSLKSLFGGLNYTMHLPVFALTWAPGICLSVTQPVHGSLLVAGWEDLHGLTMVYSQSKARDSAFMCVHVTCLGMVVAHPEVQLFTHT